jgi:outer membrane receptor for ferrienterochelin and colicin
LEKTAGGISSRWKFRQRRGLLIGAAAGCFVGALLAGAAEKTTDLKKLSLEELMGVEVGTVTTASKKEEKATDAPAMVVVITANDIRLRGYSNLKDVLRDLPGMETREFYFTEDGTEVPVRGIVGNNKIVVLVNGMRVNPPGGENFPFRSDFSVRDAEKIEVIYGSGSTLYGRDAVSMVINVITKTPGKTLSGSVNAAAGLYQERDMGGSFGGALDKEGKLKLSGYVQYHDSDLVPLDREYPDWWKDYKSVAEPKGSGMTPTRSDFGINGFARFEAGDFSLQTWYRDSKRSSSESVAPAIGFVPEATWEDYSLVSEAKYVARFSEKVRLDSAATFNRYEIDPETRYVWEDPANPSEWYFNDYKYARGMSYSMEETLRVDFTKDVSMLAGLDAAHYDIVPKCTVPGGAHGTMGDIEEEGGSFSYYKADGSGPYTIPRVWHETYEVYGGYLEGDWQVLEKLKLMAGVRVDKDTRIDDPSITPRAGAIWKATDELTVKYKYAEAYISPAPYFAYNVYQNNYQISTANPDLQPEESKTHEVDFNYAKKDFQLGLALYHGNQENLIQISDRNLPLNVIETVYLDPALTQPMYLIQSANGGSSWNQGLDFYGRCNFGPVSPWFSYSYTEFEMEADGGCWGLNGISAHNGRLGVTWAVTPKLFITPSFMIRSTPENVAPGALEDELKMPYQLNLYALYNLTDSVDLFMDLRNVTDHHYAQNGLYGTAVPQETFSGAAGVRATF